MREPRACSVEEQHIHSHIHISRARSSARVRGWSRVGDFIIVVVSKNKSPVGTSRRAFAV
jgi:hypothetical protein